MSVNVPNVNCS